MQEFYIGQLFYYRKGNKKIYARLVKIDGTILYFRKNDGVLFKGSKYRVGQTIFPSLSTSNLTYNKKPEYKFKLVKQQDNKAFERYEELGKSGLQKEDDWSKYDNKIPKW